MEGGDLAIVATGSVIGAFSVVGTGWFSVAAGATSVVMAGGTGSVGVSGCADGSEGCWPCCAM